jgi:hypothetical protein
MKKPAINEQPEAEGRGHGPKGRDEMPESTSQYR